MTKKAVVLGGAGFLGQRLVAHLLGCADATHPDWPRFDAVHVMDCERFVPRQPHDGATALTTQVGDVRSLADLRQALAGAHTVFHAASIVDVGLTKNPLIDEVNITGCRNVIAVAEELGVPYLVYTSTEDVVLDERPVANGDESLPYPAAPMHDYVHTKVEGERATLAANGRGGLHTCSIRPVHIYGPHDPHAIKHTVTEVARGKLPLLLGDGTARFDIVYVDNVVHAHLLAAARLADDERRASVAGEAFFIGENNHPNFFEFVRPYVEACGYKLPKRRLRGRALMSVARAMEYLHRLTGIEAQFHRLHVRLIARDLFFSNEKAERCLGYSPLVAPAEAQRRTLEWIVKEPLDL